METDKRVERLEYTVYGNGDDKLGLVMKIDRLEQSRLGVKDLFFILIGPVVSGAMVAIIADLLKR